MKYKTLKFIFHILFLIVMILTPIFFVSAALVPCGTSEVSVVNPETGKETNPCTFDYFFVLIKNIIDFLLVDVAAPLAALTFAVAGWMYLTAGGDSGKIKTAHELFKNVAIGFIIALSAWLVVNAILSGLGVKEAFKLLGK